MSLKINNKVLTTFPPEDWELLSAFVLLSNEKDCNIRGRSSESVDSSRWQLKRNDTHARASSRYDGEGIRDEEEAEYGTSLF